VAAASLVGLFFTWVRERADSLVAPIVVHAGTNSVALVLAYLVV
jgi:membrane protease YdiL (CAAX protease family)